MKFKIPGVALQCCHTEDGVSCETQFEAGSATFVAGDSGGSFDMFGGGGGNISLTLISDAMTKPEGWSVIGGMSGFPGFYCPEHKTTAESVREKHYDRAVKKREDCKHTLGKQYLDPKNSKVDVAEDGYPWICSDCLTFGHDRRDKPPSSFIPPNTLGRIQMILGDTSEMRKERLRELPLSDEVVTGDPQASMKFFTDLMGGRDQ